VKVTKKEMQRLFGPVIRKDGSIWADSPGVYYDHGESTASLDGRFTPEKLEAIARWMRDHAQ
jgi:hypothetical protein